MATLYIVSTPIGNLEDITHRAVRVLDEVAGIYAEDTRRTRVLTDRFEIKTPLRSLTEHNEASRSREIVERLEHGEDLALVSDAGTPLVSDPGTRLVRTVSQAGHAVVPIPGPSAVLAALVASGLPPVPFSFHGFPPKKGKDRRSLLRAVAEQTSTAVLFEAPSRLDRLLQELEAGCGPDREVAVGREITKIHEDFFRGTLAEARVYYQGRPARGEVTVVIAPGSEAVQPDADDPAVARLVEELLADGSTPKDAVTALVERLGVSRNHAYRIVQSVTQPT